MESKNQGQSKARKWPLTNQPWEVRVSIWERVRLGDRDTAIAKWSQHNILESEFGLDRGTVAKIREELFLLPEHLLPDLADPIREYRAQKLEERRGHDSARRFLSSDTDNPPWKKTTHTPTQIPNEASTRSQQPESGLTLKVVSHKIDKYESWGHHVTLAPNVEAYASAYVKVWEMVLILGGKQIEEKGASDPRELLGPETWSPVFSIPKWVRPDTYRVTVGALLVKRPRYDGFIHGLFPSAYECWDAITMSNPFEVTIPEWPTPEMKAKDEARRRANRAGMSLNVGMPSR